MTHSLGAVAMDKLFISTDIHHLKLQCHIHSLALQLQPVDLRLLALQLQPVEWWLWALCFWWLQWTLPPCCCEDCNPRLVTNCRFELPSLCLNLFEPLVEHFIYLVYASTYLNLCMMMAVHFSCIYLFFDPIIILMLLEVCWKLLFKRDSASMFLILTFQSKLLLYK